MSTATEKQEAIQRLVRDQPAVHFRGIASALHIPLGNLRIHIDKLTSTGVIIEVKDGAYRRYFAPAVDPILRPILVVLSHEGPGRIAEILLLGPKTRKEMLQHLQCGETTLSFYLQQLLRGQVVTKQAAAPGSTSAQYALLNPSDVRRALELLRPRTPAGEAA